MITSLCVWNSHGNFFVVLHNVPKCHYDFGCHCVGLFHLSETGSQVVFWVNTVFSLETWTISTNLLPFPLSLQFLSHSDLQLRYGIERFNSLMSITLATQICKKITKFRTRYGSLASSVSLFLPLPPLLPCHLLPYILWWQAGRH